MPIVVRGMEGVNTTDPYSRMIATKHINVVPKFKVLYINHWRFVIGEICTVIPMILLKVHS